MNDLEVLKGKTIVILYSKENKDMYSEACDLYIHLAQKGLISIFVTNKNALDLIENSGYDLRYVFLYDGAEVPTQEQGKSIYHLHHVANPHHYWLDALDEEHYNKAVSYFVEVEKELSNV